MVRGFDFSREAFEENMLSVVEENSLVGMYDVTTTMLDRGKVVSDRVYFIPFDSTCNLVIYSTVDVFTDRSPVESTSRWDVEMYWVFEDVAGIHSSLFRRIDRTYDMFDVMDDVVKEAKDEYTKVCMNRRLLKGTEFKNGFPYE